MKLAIIGTSIGQRALYEKAFLCGHDVVSFSLDAGCIPSGLIGDFQQISIVEVEQIVKRCHEKGVQGVVTNGSTLTAQITAQVAEQMDLPGVPSKALNLILEKQFVREQTKDILGLFPVAYSLYDGAIPSRFPCIVKPISGGGKKGVSIATDADSFQRALTYAAGAKQIMVETYVEGAEVSVEAISFAGQHQVVQITDKVSTGAPHFVELAHHQPSRLPEEVKTRIRKLVPEILTRIGYTFGPSHTEMKITREGQIALVEVNPRGGGDEISSTLVGLSTDFDYLKAMIDVALGIYQPRPVHDVAYAGICYVCAQAKDMWSFYANAETYPWFVRKEQHLMDAELVVAKGNNDRNASFIYCSPTPVVELLKDLY